ncbi:hypothetical protein D3C71_1299890 [compost metagenome]
MGYFSLTREGIAPGAGVGKNLGYVGDYSITRTVAKKGIGVFERLNAVKVSFALESACLITEAICEKLNVPFHLERDFIALLGKLLSGDYRPNYSEESGVVENIKNGYETVFNDLDGEDTISSVLDKVYNSNLYNSIVGKVVKEYGQRKSGFFIEL